MIKTNIGHILLNADPKNFPFYKDLFIFLGWNVIMYEENAVLGMGDSVGGSVWFANPIKPIKNDYDGTGMNHLAVSAASVADVDQVVAYLKEHGVKALFETPRHRPDFSSGPDQTYYQVMFESPDRLLFEVVYTGPK